MIVKEEIVVKFSDFNAITTVLQRLLEDSLKLSFVSIAGYSKDDRATLLRELKQVKDEIYQENQVHEQEEGHSINEEPRASDPT